MAVSPDGTQVAYVAQKLDAPPGPARNQLFVRSLGSLAVRALPGTQGAAQPFFSPDGQWIAFCGLTNAPQRGLKKVALAGGNPLTLVDTLEGGNWGFGVWADDETIIFGSGNTAGLERIAADGGSSQKLTTLNAGESRHTPTGLVPGTQAALFTVEFSQLRDPRVDAVIFDSGERRVVVETAE